MLALAACGGGDGVAGWLAEDAEGAMFMSWTRHGDELVGVVTQAHLVGARHLVDVAVESTDFTGVADGDSVTLTFDVSFPMLSRVWTGTLDDDTLTFAVPSEDGLDTVRLEEGTSGDFNAAVARLRDTAAEEADRARLGNAQLEFADVEAEAEALLATLREQHEEAERLLAVVENEADDEPPEGWAGMDALAAYEVQWAADEVRWRAVDVAEDVASDLRSVAATGHELAAEVARLAERLGGAVVVAPEEVATSHLDEVVSAGEDVLAATVAAAEAADRLAAEAWARSAAEGGPDGPEDGEPLDW